MVGASTTMLDVRSTSGIASTGGYSTRPAGEASGLARLRTRPLDAMPKSSTFTTELPVSMILPGFEIAVHDPLGVRRYEDVRDCSAMRSFVAPSSFDSSAVPSVLPSISSMTSQSVSRPST